MTSFARVAVVLGVLLPGLAAAERRKSSLPEDVATARFPHRPRGDEHRYAGDGLYRPPIEWSTWIRVGYGFARETPVGLAPTPAPIDGIRGDVRMTLAPIDGMRRDAPMTPAPLDGMRREAPLTLAWLLGPSAPEHHGTWDVGFGIEASVAASPHGDLRFGAWLEQRGSDLDATFAGAEVVLTRVPRTLHMFLYEGHGIVAVRAGRSRDEATASVSYGYLAPFWLEGPCYRRFYDIYTGVCSPRPERTARYMAGVRVVATVTRALEAPHDWLGTLGLEFEPAGAWRMLTMARSWYEN